MGEAENEAGAEPAQSESAPVISLEEESVFETWESIDDAAEDGWDSEAFSESATKVLMRLGDQILVGESPSMAMLAPILHPEVSLHGLPPGFAETRYEYHGGITVIRAEGGGSASELEQLQLKGPNEVISWLRETYGSDDLEGGRFKAKVIAVDLDREDLTQATTKVSIENLGLRESARESTGRWLVRWSREDAPLITSIVIEEHSVTMTDSLAETAMFVDCTRSSIGDSVLLDSQILRGFPHWKERRILERSSELYGFNGLAAGDPNGDGREDFYFCESRGVPNLLFFQNPDGTFSEAAEEWKVDWLEDTRSALLLDLDNDGDDDLVAVTIGFVVMAENVGDSFRFAAALPCSNDVNHLTAADADLDGRLDLYVCAYFRNHGSARNELREAHPSLYLDSDAGAPNTLFINRATESHANWVFEDVTASIGLDESNLGQTLSAAWEDFDRDGDPDLYVANDFGKNRLYRNELIPSKDFRFSEISRESGSEDTNFGMSAAWGDPNRDGWLDLHISNMWSSAGKRVVSLNRFKPELDDQQRDLYLRFARGNTLLKNLGDGTFTDTSEVTGITKGRWAWSSPWTDFNNDGWEDLVVANGYITGTGPGDL